MYINISSQQRSISPLKNVHSPKDASPLTVTFLCPTPLQNIASTLSASLLLSYCTSPPLKYHLLPCSCTPSPQLLQAPWNTQQNWKLQLHTRSITHIRMLYVDPVPIYSIFLPCSAGKTLLLHFGQQHEHWIISQRGTLRELMSCTHFGSWSLAIVIIKWKWTRCRKKAAKISLERAFFFFLKGD